MPQPRAPPTPRNPRWVPVEGKKRNVWPTMRRLLRYMGKYRREVYAGVILAVLATVLSLITPQLLGDITDEISRGVLSNTDIDMGYIAETALWMIVMYVASAVLTGGSDYLIPAASEKVANSVRRDLAKKIHTVPLSYYDKRSTGDVMSLMTNDADIIGDRSADCISQMVNSVVVAAGAVIMMLYTDWKLALLSALPTAAGLLFMFWVIRHAGKYYSRQSRDLGMINAIVDETYYGHDIVRVYNNEEGSEKEFAAVNRDLRKSSFLARAMSGTMSPAISFVSNIGYVAVCVFGSMMIVDGEIGYGVVVAFIVYISMISRPMLMLSEAFNSMQSVAASAERVFAFLDAKDMKDEGTDEPPADVKGGVEFRDLRFSYVPGNEVIRGLNLDIRPGQKVAIVGPTGAGKTTLASLLLRFYDADSGDILIDGNSIYGMKRGCVRSLFCTVLQDTWVFEGTLRGNIAYGSPGLSDDDIMRAAEEAGLGDLVRSRGEGLDLKVTGDDLSAGQRQQIAIARAMAKDAPLLILDEATSSVDTLTERKIQDAMDSLMSGRTSFVIAHRLSTIVNSDLILVVRDGEIVEKGTHSELMEMDGFYRSLYDSQFEGCD
jgi:ATP-binding cassette subfamily B multidrug efflux pump